jgi:hypothetical protein
VGLSAAAIAVLFTKQENFCMRGNPYWILWITLAFLSQQAFSQATAPAPLKPAGASLPQSNLPESPGNGQLRASTPGADAGTGAISVLTVQLDTLKQVLAIAMSEEEVKKVVDFEDAKFRKDDSAKLAHRREVVVAVVTRLKENCK